MNPEPMTNFKNRTVWIGDNLDVMRGINSNSIDLIYLDPPFNSNKNYSAPIGSKAAGAAFKDTWSLSDLDTAWTGLIAEQHPAIYKVLEAAQAAHGKSMQSYLCMMAVRLLEMHRILKDTGSLYLHCDPTASHYLKLLLDTVFGQSQFRNECVWCYASGGVSKRWFGKKHDVILLYSKSNTYNFNPQYRPYSEGTVERGLTQYKKNINEKYTLSSKGAIQNDWWADITPLLSPTSYERLGYPTQKPKALLQRIIRASSNKGDIVLDPFAGCATACVVAEDEGRQWIGIDLSPVAGKLVRERLHDPKYRTFYPESQIFLRDSDLPVRSDIGKLPNYRKRKHILFGEQEGCCAGCREAFPFKVFEVDHIVPKSKGGTDHPDNLQMLCGHCNKIKGAKSQAYLISKLREMAYVEA